MQRKYNLRFGEMPVALVQFAADMVSWKQQKQGDKSPQDGGKRMAQKPEEHAADMVSREEYEQLKSRNAELEQQVNALTEALRLAQHKRFGASSEKTVERRQPAAELPVQRSGSHRRS